MSTCDKHLPKWLHEVDGVAVCVMCLEFELQQTNRLKDEAEKKMRQWDRIITAALAWEAIPTNDDEANDKALDLLIDVIRDYRNDTEKRVGGSPNGEPEKP